MNWRFSSVKQILRLPSMSAFAGDDTTMNAARYTVSLFYSLTVVMALLFFSSNLSGQAFFEPFWPIAWAKAFELEFETIEFVIKFAFMLITILSVYYIHID